MDFSVEISENMNTPVALLEDWILYILPTKS